MTWLLLLLLTLAPVPHHPAPEPTGITFRVAPDAFTLFTPQPGSEMLGYVSPQTDPHTTTTLLVFTADRVFYHGRPVPLSRVAELMPGRLVLVEGFHRSYYFYRD